MNRYEIEDIEPGSVLEEMGVEPGDRIFMRETLYIKDDDERLSFLQGNYVTLTNLSEFEKNRIVDYHIMPINVSIHTTNGKKRCQMLNNRFAGTIMEDLRFFAQHNIQMNGQIVLCPGYNDGEALKETLTDLMTFYPALTSVSVVPVGLSRFREGLAALNPVDCEKAKESLDIIHAVQEKMQENHGFRFVFPGDELFLLAKEPIPGPSYYEDFAQLENGVGMMADFKQSLEVALQGESGELSGSVGIITGQLAKAYMEDCVRLISAHYPGVKMAVYPIVNHYFGQSITVSGLVTGTDILAQLKEKEKRDVYFIPENMVRYHTEDFLDDLTVENVSAALGTPIKVVPVDGGALINRIKENL